MNLKLGWKKGKGISMASIRERNGKFNVIYNYKDDSGKRRQKWETYDTKAEAKKRKREIEYKQEMGSACCEKVQYIVGSAHGIRFSVWKKKMGIIHL